MTSHDQSFEQLSTPSHFRFDFSHLNCETSKDEMNGPPMGLIPEILDLCMILNHFLPWGSLHCSNCSRTLWRLNNRTEPWIKPGSPRFTNENVGFKH
jgi:hypothetical protein